MGAITDEGGHVAEITTAGELLVRLPASQVGGTSGLTDTQLRATAVPISTAKVIVSGSGAAVNATPMAATQVTGNWISIQLTGPFVATTQFEQSNDSTNGSDGTWASLPLLLGTMVTAGTPPIVFTATVGFWHGPISALWVRARISAYTSGSVVATAVISSTAVALTSISVDTELIQVTLGDAIANPTSPSVASLPLGWNGATWERLRVANTFKTLAAVAITAGTPVIVWTPTAGKKFRLLGYSLSLSVAGAVILDDVAAEFIRTPLMAAGVGTSSPAPMGNGFLSAAANNTLKLDVTATGSVSGFVFGTEE